MTKQIIDPGHTELMKAIIEQDVDYVKALVESGAELEVRDKIGQNALYHAIPEPISQAALEILIYLIDNGINTSSSLDGDGCSALVTAIVMGSSEIVQRLVDNGVDVNEGAASKFSGSLSSDPAYQNNKVEESKAKTQFIFSKGCGHFVTPLLCAVLYQRSEIFKILLKSKASATFISHGTFWRASMSSVCSNCDVSVTPLHMAAYLGNLELTYALLSNDKIIMTEDLDKSNSSLNSFNAISPLWFALLQGHEKIVKLFLSLGKPVALPCHFGSGLQVCLEEGHIACALMILRAGYDIDDDMEWIEEEKYPTSNVEVIEKIEDLFCQPRPLLDWCGTSLRKRFGLHLDQYLDLMEAPRKVFDILNFNDLTPLSWQKDVISDGLTQNRVICKDLDNPDIFYLTI